MLLAVSLDHITSICKFLNTRQQIKQNVTKHQRTNLQKLCILDRQFVLILMRKGLQIPGKISSSLRGLRKSHASSNFIFEREVSTNGNNNASICSISRPQSHHNPTSKSSLESARAFLITWTLITSSQFFIILSNVANHHYHAGTGPI